MSYLLASKTHCCVPLFFKLKQKKNMCPRPFFIMYFEFGFYMLFVCVLCSFDKLGFWGGASSVLSIFISFTQAFLQLFCIPLL